jgi:Spy/CpxP family protein refolding chaperone
MQRTRKNEDNSGRDLMDAIAATIQAGSAGRNAIEKIREKMKSEEKAQHVKDMGRWKR